MPQTLTAEKQALLRSIDAVLEVTQPGRLRAVAYLRVSTEDQKKGYGISYTGKRVVRHIAKKGWAFTGVYADEGFSGSLEAADRPDLLGLMEAARESPRPFDVVTVYEARAIGRRDRAFWPWVWELEELGVFVAVVKGDYDNTTDEGRSRMRKDADRAEDERIVIRDRTQGGLQEKAEEGGYTGGYVPFGFRVENQGIKGESRLGLQPADVATLHRAREIFVRTKNWPDTAATLNAEGLLTRSGRPWRHDNLQKIMTGDPVMHARIIFRKTRKAVLDRDGKPLYGDQVVIDLPRIFSEEQTEELREAVRLVKRGPQVKRGRVYPWTGRIVSRCGGRYTGWLRNGGSPRYRCCTSCDVLDAESVEEALWTVFCGALGDIERLRSVAEDWAGVTSGQGVNHVQRLAELDKQTATLRKTIRITTSMTVRAALDEDATEAEAEAEASAAVRPLREELSSLEKLRSEVAAWQAETEQAGQRAQDLLLMAQAAHQRLEKLPPEQRRRLLTLLDATATVTGPAPTGRAGAVCSLAAWFRSRSRLVPDLDDEAWEKVAGLIPRPRKLDARMAVEGLLYKARTGVQWKRMPEQYGSGATLNMAWRRWNETGLWEQVMDLLTDAPGQAPYEPKTPAPPMSIHTWVIPELLLKSELHLAGGSGRQGFTRVLFKFPITLAA